MAATTEKKTVVIIGAGLSGLQAAVKLIQSGSFQVKLLEATDQAGGRVNTSWKFGSFPIELGANWIHGNHGNPVYELAKKHKLLHDGGKNVLNRFGEWFDDEDENYFYTENGMKINYKLAKKAVDIYHKIVDKCDNTGQKLDDGSRANVGDMIDNEGIKEIEKLKLTEKERRQMLGLLEWAKKLECVDNACQSTYDLSLRWFGEYVALPGDYYTEMGQGGYQALVDLLLSKIPVECLQYNKPVKSVDWCGAKSERSEVKDDRHAIGVECTDGEKVTADHVIVTTSLGFLKENSETFFNPVLPEEKLEAISKVGYGNIGKIFLRFKNRFWNKHLDGIQFIWDSCDAASSKETQSKTSHEEWMKSNWFRNICGFERVLYHKTTLVGWIYGKEAEYMESLDDEEIKN
ncbi:peroxisomal N(1)-acetyl-spermine/spermidine oxidase-like, partial [Saccoglossus kowalevskii]|uniref:Peroxisomal N(1)-acetyl-spermine/spermidine oxidase-like n=1 Tax=Saccoglossus kowalevskii TaxID=10224 RepID=A0ABM0MSD2_SACKO